MNITLTRSLAWIVYPSCLRFCHTIFASFMMSLSLSACSENVSESNQATMPSDNGVSSQHETEPRKADANVIPPIHAPKNALKTSDQAVPTFPKVSWVLDGTDLLKISEVKHSNGASDTDWSGHYSSEQGGSLLSLRIESHGQGQWSLSRNYSEPALKTHTKKYDLHATNEGLASTTVDLVIKKTEAGVLVFEANSGVSSIPASYWVHYLKNH